MTSGSWPTPAAITMRDAQDIIARRVANERAAARIAFRIEDFQDDMSIAYHRSRVFLAVANMEEAPA